nr:PAS domain S-box protein [Desulfobulbaceae bacterium]
MAQFEDIFDQNELKSAFGRICTTACRRGWFLADLNLTKLYPLFVRIANDLYTCSASPHQNLNQEPVVLENASLWVRTSQLIPITFDLSYRVAGLICDMFSGEIDDTEKPALKKKRDSFPDTFTAIVPGQIVRAYSKAFLLSLSKEWLRLATLPYHKKLREANRYILLEKRRYFTIFNRMSEPAFIVDHDLHILDTNKAFMEFFQLSGKDHLGKTCLEVLGEDLCVLCRLEKVLDKHRSFSGIEAEISVNGERHYVVVSGTFLGDINNDFSGGIIILQDITSNKKTQSALRDSEEKYRSLIENVPDVTWRSDPYGHLTYISPNFEKICGYNPIDLNGAGASDKFAMIHPDDVDMVRNEFGLFFVSRLPDGSILRNLPGDEVEWSMDEHALNGLKKYDVTYRYRKNDGSWMWVHDRASKIYEQDGCWYTDGVFSDVTDLKEAEAELEKHHFRLAELVDERTSELRRVNKNLKKEISFRKKAENDLLLLASKLSVSNQELEQFAHVASHDLKEPLMLIKAFSEKLLSKHHRSLDTKGEEYLQRIISATERMSELIEGLLALSRITSAEQKYEKIDLTDLVREVIENLETRIHETDGTVEIKTLGCLGGDRVQLRQLFQNLIANALKFRKAGHGPTVKISSFFVDDVCEIFVEDDGIGFEQSHGEQIFKPLQRLHSRREFEGTGLGLATCRKIVTRHGGEIEAKGEPDKGAVFIIRLPVHKKMTEEK